MKQCLQRPGVRPLFWGLVFILGCLLLGGGAGLSTERVPRGIATAGDGSLFIRYTGRQQALSGGLVEERALLYDSEPLFLPTLWNWKGGGVPLYRGEGLSSALFQSFDPQIQLTEESWGLLKQFTRECPLLMEAYGVLDWDYWTLFARLPQDEFLLQGAGEAACLRVYEMGTGVLVFDGEILTEGLGLDQAPLFFEGIHFLVFIHDSGRASPTLMLDSTWEKAIDQALWRYVEAQLKGWAPGYYRVQIGL